jgi:DNA-binding MarR family transcriptional regulator/GNAT superfamily N-acetyltransferase
MRIGAKIGPRLGEQIAAVRAFNRFYTARLGLLRKRHFDGEFSLTEARILYEIGTHPRMTATALRNTLELDAGYVSRLLALLTRRMLVRRTASKADGREKPLTLTAAGEKAVARLDEQSTVQIHGILGGLPAAERETMVASLGKVRDILSVREKLAVRIDRLTSANDDALAILEEYYEAAHVVQRDEPDAIGKIAEEPGSGVWLAMLNDEVVGCAVLRKLTAIPLAAECKRLYVRPASRGRGIADLLLDAQETYARSQGLAWIYLDTYDDLKTAIALYERRGYTRCARYNDNPQATVFMRKRIA